MNHKHKLYIDNVVLFANYIYVDGWCGQGEERVVISVASGSDGEPRILPGLATKKISRPDVARALKLENDENAPVGFVFKAPFEAIADFQPTETVLKWVAANDGLTTQTMAKAKTIGEFGGRLNPSASDTVRRAISCNLVDPAVAAFFLAFSNNGHGLPALRGHVDAVMRAGSTLGVDLWVENAGARTLVALTNDGALAVDPSQTIVSLRPDVTEALRAEGATIVTDGHGVFLLFRSFSTGAKGLVVGAYGDGGIQAVFSTAIAASEGRERLVERLVGLLGYRGFPPPAIAETVFRPLIEPSRAQPAAEARLVILAAAQPPKMSIIVPLFREYYFIRSLLSMQLRLGDFAEWIFVSDDPSIHASLETFLQTRTNFLRANTTLVLNKENYGYSLSNLVGARFAKTDNLLFMNSDIWIDNPQPLLRGLQALQEGEYGLIGFRLLYEDGTVQHDGFAFERRSEIHNLFAVDHPGKGLPPPPADHSLRIVPAVGVTGALLLTTRQVFDDVGGFSSEYVLGDFEDADLCLKVGKSGRKVGLVQAPGIYHLERQSIRKLGQIGYRQTVTFLNCIHFNRVWKDHLERGQRRGWSRHADPKPSRG